MIKSNELRIGNKILYGNLPVTVYSVSMNGDIWSCGNTAPARLTNVDDIKPIPLTAELLTQCKFKRDEREDWGGDIFYVWYNNFDIHEDWDGKNYMFAVYVKGEERSFKSGYVINYLHELQNLYFAITKQELVLP